MVAAFLAVVLCVMCLPLLSGCKAGLVYTLNTDEEGNKYYVLSSSGFASSLKGELEIPEYYGEGENYAPVTEIAQQGLAGTAYTKITVPETVKTIGVAAFSYDYSLKEVVFADGIEIEEIPQGAFGYCESLQKIVVPDSVKSIGYMAFYECENLSSVILPEGLEIIYAEAFEGCQALGEITLPQTLTTIGSLAFYTSGLTEIVIPDSVRDIEITLTDENGDTQLDDDGNPVTSVMYGLGYAAFHTCESLTKAVVGSGVTVLRSGVFGYCPALKEIYLPAGLEEVEGAYYVESSFYYGHPFHNDTALTDVYYAGTEEQWKALLKKVDDTSVSSNGATYDNSALLNAQIHCETSY